MLSFLHARRTLGRRSANARPRARLWLTLLEERANPATIYDNGVFVLKFEDGGLSEAAVPMYFNGALQGSFKLIEGYELIPGTGSYPQFWAAISNGYFRQTYPSGGGQTASFGTSLITSLSYRTNTSFNLIPTMTRIDVSIANAVTTIQYTGNFGTEATESISLRIPQYGSSAKATATVQFTTLTTIPLASALFGNDAFRGPSISGMNVAPQQYDVSDYLFKDNNQVAQHLVVSSLPGDQHFFPAPWLFTRNNPTLSAIKQPGSTWFGASPSLAVTLRKATIALPNSPAQALSAGFQGFWLESSNPNDDNLSSWFELLGTPNVLPASTTVRVEYDVVASAPQVLSERRAGAAVLAPRGAISQVQPTLVWSQVLGAMQYEYQVLNAQGTIVATGTTMTEFHPLTTMLPRGNYRTRIRTYNTANEPGPWGVLTPFQVTVPAPIVLGPTGTLSDRTPTITFNPQVSDATNDIAVLNAAGTLVVTATHLPTTTYTVPNALGQGMYRVLVRSRNPLGEYSGWSMPAFFKIDVPTPGATVAHGPTGMVAEVNPTFAWDAPLYGRYYDLRIDDLTTQQNGWLKRRLDGTSWTRDFPFAPHQYRWWLRALNEVGEAGPWVQAGTFTIQGDVLADLAATRHWTSFAPRHYNPDLNQFPTEAQLRDDLVQLWSEGFRGLITWSMDGTLRSVPRLAKELGFVYVVSGIYYYDAAQLAREYTACIDEQSYIDAFVVGNEGLQIGQRYTLTQLQQVMSDLKAATNKPVATCETGGFYLQHPELLAEGDFVLTNIHPWWANIRAIPAAVQHTVNEYHAIDALMPPGKLLYVRESWWPNGGGDPAATPANQRDYFTTLSNANVALAYGAAYDQPFQILNGEPPWGLHSANGVPYPALNALKPIIRDPR